MQTGHRWSIVRAVASGSARRLAAGAGVVTLCLFALPPAWPPGQSRLDAQPASLDEALLSASRWRSIGPNRGGRSIAVSGVKGRPREAYFGAVGGGLWKTTDAGHSWARSPTDS
jgi:hypothetical protein